MPRQPRLLLPHSFYHIITRGNNKNQIFRDKKDYLAYFKILKKYKQEHPFDLYHYVLMPNHTHFLIKTKDKDFSVFMKKLDLAYFYHFKFRYGWVGHFWQGRFKSQPVGKDEYFIQAGKYIELNPVKAKIVKFPEDYQFSSYKFYAFGKADSLVTSDFFYEQLGKNSKKRQGNYQKLLIDDIVEDSYKKPVWGSFPQRKNEQNKIDYRLKKKGRRKTFKI